MDNSDTNIPRDLGFIDGSQDMRRHPKEMYENRDKAFEIAAKELFGDSLDAYKEGYNAAVIAHIEAKGAQQAIYDRAKGHDKGDLDNHMSALAERFKESAHIKAFEAGYKRELGLDREPLGIESSRPSPLTSDDIKARVETTRNKIKETMENQRELHARAWLQGSKEATATIDAAGMKSAVDRIKTLPERVKGVTGPLELKAYMGGYEDTINANVDSIAASLAGQAASWSWSASRLEAVREHIANASKVMGDKFDLFGEKYIEAYRQCREAIIGKEREATTDLKQGEKFEVKQKQQEPCLGM